MPGVRGTPEERFWAKVDKSGDCWLWTGAVDKGTGYGRFWNGERTVLPHRRNRLFTHNDADRVEV